jgi:hypothetical protein
MPKTIRRIATRRPRLSLALIAGRHREYLARAIAVQDLDRWVEHYNHHREHQAIGDVAPIRRFELAERRPTDVIDGEVEIEQVLQEKPKVVGRRVDGAGRISILKHRYHVGRHLAGEQVAVESRDGLLHVTHNGVVIATHARRHLLDDDDKMDRQSPERWAKYGNELEPSRDHRGWFVGRFVEEAPEKTEE